MHMQSAESSVLWSKCTGLMGVPTVVVTVLAAFALYGLERAALHLPHPSFNPSTPPPPPVPPVPNPVAHFLPPRNATSLH